MPYFDFSTTPITSDITLKARWCCAEPPEPEVTTITLEFTGSGLASFQNKWLKTIKIGDKTVAGGASSTLSVVPGMTVEISEQEDGGFGYWGNNSLPLVANVPCKIISMPKMEMFTVPGAVTDNMFYAFNNSGTITEYPAGSFDTSKITTFGNMCFRYFNRQNTMLTSLPEGSFNFDNAVNVGTYFCQNFNRDSTKLTQLPAGSFNFPELVSTGSNMFASFNLNGSLTSLPSGSFQFPKMTTVGGGFGYYFNGGGKISQLPKDSFNVDAVTSASGTMFEAFNGVSGQLGLLARDNVNYTPTRNKTSAAITAYYYPSGSENVAVNGQFHWKMSTT